MVDRRFQRLLLSILAGAFLILWLCPQCPAQIPLPTPQSHHERYRGLSGPPLFTAILNELDPSARQLFMKLAASTGLVKIPSIVDANSAVPKPALDRKAAGGLSRTAPLSKQQAMDLIRSTEWAPVRRQLLELIVHQSQVLDMIPPEWGSIWYPIVHDALLFFLDHLPEDRLQEKADRARFTPSGKPAGRIPLGFRFQDSQPPKGRSGACQESGSGSGLSLGFAAPRKQYPHFITGGVGRIHSQRRRRGGDREISD